MKNKMDDEDWLVRFQGMMNYNVGSISNPKSATLYRALGIDRQEGRSVIIPE